MRGEHVGERCHGSAKATTLRRDAFVRRRGTILGNNVVSPGFPQLCRNAVATRQTRGLGHGSYDVYGRNSLFIGHEHRKIGLTGTGIDRYQSTAAALRGRNRPPRAVALYPVALNVNQFALDQFRGCRLLIVVEHHLGAIVMARQKSHHRVT